MGRKQNVVVIIDSIKKKAGAITEHSLIRNAFYLMASTIVLSAFGFLFWIIAARLFSPHDVGIGTALISSMTIIVALSTLGFDNSILRFLGSAHDKNTRLTTILTLTTISSICIAVGFLVLSSRLAPDLHFVAANLEYALLFVTIIVLLCANGILDSTFIAYRSARNILLKSTVYSIAKVALLFAVVGLGAFGIFFANGIALLLGVGLALGILIKKYDYAPLSRPRLASIKGMSSFTAVSYIASCTSNLTTSLLPIIVLNHLGAASAALYYLSMMVSTMLAVIPKATSQSLLAEGAAEHSDLRSITHKTLKTTFILLLPAIAIIFFGGELLMMLFGKDYSSNTTHLLQILAIANVSMAVNYIGDALLHIQKRVRLFLFINTFNTVLILAGCLYLVRYGLDGIGWAWLGGQIITSLLYLVIFSKPIKRVLVKRQDLYDAIKV